ncbi:phosphoenolpyruvate synthase, partial [Kocuria oceani]|uniref:phosphoenolpyruvate synthase n=1 Tax=Kocuria oceani TaxID=988827 RepID=UPI002406BA2D
MTSVLPFTDIDLSDLEEVGGKNASLGELIRNLSNAGVQVPGGFATTATAFRQFLAADGLDTRIAQTLEGLDTADVTALAAAGAHIRSLIRNAPLPDGLETGVRDAYEKVAGTHPAGVSWAVRSSATAEDLPDASFAGQQETYLNIRGVENVLAAVKDVFASLYNDRAIAYRVHHGFTHAEVALSAGVQKMVRSDVGASGVMFTMDTESGFTDAVFITSSYGLGEAVVQGAVNPDEFYVHKPALAAGRPAVLKRGLGGKALQMTYTDSQELGETVGFVPVPQAQRGRFSLTDAQVEQLARYAVAIEAHYGRPMDIEWGLDGTDGRLYILQARPETVVSRRGAGAVARYRLHETGTVVAQGRAIGQRIGAGQVRVLGSHEEMASFQAGDVLVASMTDPDWEPIMKKAAAIVTDRGGRTCHAA